MLTEPAQEDQVVLTGSQVRSPPVMHWVNILLTTRSSATEMSEKPASTMEENK